MLRSSLIVTLFGFLASLLAFLNQVMLARFFGAGEEMDAYLIAISLPLTLSALFSGVLGSQVVPALQQAEVKTGSSDALLKSLVVGLGCGTALAALFGCIAAEMLIALVAQKSSSAVQVLAADIARVAWWWLPLAVVGAVYTAGLHIRQRFLISMLLQMLPVVGTLISCLIAHQYVGVRALVWGQLAGYLAMVVSLRSTLGGKPSACDWVGLRELLAQTPMALLALLIFVICPFSDAIWGSHAGPAGVSHLAYAQRLVVGFSGLAVAGAVTVLFPHFARQSAEGNSEALHRHLAKTLRGILVCMVPASVLLGMLALPVSQLLFERGAFNLTDSLALAALLPSMLVGLVAMSCMGLTFKAYFAQGMLRAAAIMSVGGVIIYFTLSGIFVGQFGLPGIGIAYAVSWWLVFICSLRYLWRGTPLAQLVKVNLRFVSRMSAAAVLVGVVCWLGAQFLPAAQSADQLSRLLVIAGTSALAILSYLAVGNSFLAIDELRMLVQHVLNLMNRK